MLDIGTSWTSVLETELVRVLGTSCPESSLAPPPQGGRPHPSLGQTGSRFCPRLFLQLLPKQLLLSQAPAFSFSKSAPKRGCLLLLASPGNRSPVLAAGESRLLHLSLHRKASGPITSWQIDGETVETVTDYFLGSKISADGDCSHEIKRHLLLGRKAVTNLNSLLKSRDITLATKVHLVKAMVFPVVTYGCESWTIKLSSKQLMLLNCGVGEDS